MRRFTRLLLILTSLLCCVGAADAAGKVSVDPNAARKPAVLKDAADARLDQKVTVQFAGVRLHTVLEQLSASTGVTIRCARNKNEWQVRDLPVFVSAKDIPLGKMLRSIADSSHLVLTSSRVADVVSYRIWRDLGKERLMTECTAASDNNAKARDMWAWDALVKLADAPDSVWNVPSADEKQREQMEDVRDVSKLLTHLDPDARQKVYDHQTVSLAAKDLPGLAWKPLENAARRCWDSCKDLREKHIRNNPGSTDIPNDLSPQDLEKASLSLYLCPGDTPDVTVSIRITGLSSSTDLGYYGQAVDRVVAAHGKDLDIPPRPVVQSADELSRSALSVESKDLKALRLDADWDIPLLKTKLKLDRPKDRKAVTCADILSALSDASGCTIVCEDFYTHNRKRDYADVFKPDTTLGGCLKQIGRFTWLVREQDKLVIGWADEWYKHAHDLAPESLVNNLIVALSGKGVGIDDFAPVAYLSWDQRWEWIVSSRGMGGARWGTFMELDRPLWQFYSNLSAQDKTLAKSEMGLPLAKFDRMWLSALFKQVNAHCQSELSAVGSASDAYQVPTDPDDIGKLVLKINSEIPSAANLPGPEDDLHFPDSKAVPKDFAKRIYYMKIEGDIDGEKREVATGAPLFIYFPAYSPEREAELLKKAGAPKNPQ